jgi:hypothetical protein
MIVMFFTINVFSQVPTDNLISSFLFDSINNSIGLHDSSFYRVVFDTDRFGNDFNACAFNGNNSFIWLPQDYDYPEKTISLWFKSTNVSEGEIQRLYYSDHDTIQYGSTVIDLSSDTSDTKNVLRLVNGGGQGTPIYDTIEIDTWYHALLSVSLDTVVAYINGVFKGSADYSDHHSTSGFGYAFLGCNRDTNNYFFQGKIDDVRIYNRVLSENEIDALYNETINSLDEQIGYKLNIFPNPAKSGETIRINLEQHDYTLLRVYDINGRIVQESNDISENTTLNISQKSGLYIIQLFNINNGKSINAKILIE